MCVEKTTPDTARKFSTSCTHSDNLDITAVRSGSSGGEKIRI